MNDDQSQPHTEVYVDCLLSVYWRDDDHRGEHVRDVLRAALEQMRDKGALAHVFTFEHRWRDDKSSGDTTIHLNTGYHKKIMEPFPRTSQGDPGINHKAERCIDELVSNSLIVPNVRVRFMVALGHYCPFITRAYFVPALENCDLLDGVRHAACVGRRSAELVMELAPKH